MRCLEMGLAWCLVLKNDVPWSGSARVKMGVLCAAHIYTMHNMLSAPPPQGGVLRENFLTSPEITCDLNMSGLKTPLHERTQGAFIIHVCHC